MTYQDTERRSIWLEHSTWRWEETEEGEQAGLGKIKTLKTVRVYSSSKRKPTEEIMYLLWDLFYVDYDPRELWKWG